MLALYHDCVYLFYHHFSKRKLILIQFLLQSGKDNLRTVSRRQVIKSTIDLIEKSPPRSFSEFTKSANEIKKLMDVFNDKMALLQAEGYDEKKLLNAKKESNKLKDLTFLKGQTPPDQAPSALYKKLIII